ncbi:MAG: site-specific integrase [Pirellulales bacterium]|nr:site-specific integrase [Pirellulales bacterium]
MATIFKRARDKKNRQAVYWIQYFDEQGKRRQVKGFTDRALSAELAAKLESEVRARTSGLVDPDLERASDQRRLPIDSHIKAFRKAIGHNTSKYVSLVTNRVSKVLSGCKFECLADVDREAIVDYLAELRQEKNLGNRSYNHYGDALDAFGKWLVSDKRSLFNPFDNLPRLNAEVDIRHKRRALSPEDVTKLIEAARASKKLVQLYPGELRARLYLMAFLTGLRRRELASLTSKNFTLDDEQPIVVVEAAFSKHRRKDTLPLHPELILLLRTWLPTLGPDEPLFPKLAKKKTYTMVQKDLKAAGIPYETAEGLADFHAAGRHSHITGLLKNGASVTEAKELARHTDVRMTMKYTHVGLKDQARALANLPSPTLKPGEDGNTVAASHSTGNGQKMNGPAPVNGRSLAAHRLQLCSSDGHSGSSSDTEGKNGSRPRNDASPSEEGLLASDDSESHPVAAMVKSGGGGNRTPIRFWRNWPRLLRLRQRPTPPRCTCAAVDARQSAGFGVG